MHLVLQVVILSDVYTRTTFDTHMQICIYLLAKPPSVPSSVTEFIKALQLSAGFIRDLQLFAISWFSSHRRTEKCLSNYKVI